MTSLNQFYSSLLWLDWNKFLLWPTHHLSQLHSTGIGGRGSCVSDNLTPCCPAGVCPHPLMWWYVPNLAPKHTGPNAITAPDVTSKLPHWNNKSEEERGGGVLCFMVGNLDYSRSACWLSDTAHGLVYFYCLHFISALVIGPNLTLYCDDPGRPPVSPAVTQCTVVHKWDLRMTSTNLSVMC